MTVLLTAAQLALLLAGAVLLLGAVLLQVYLGLLLLTTPAP